MPNPAQKKPAVVRTVAALRRKRDQWKRDTVALVPTMGALHSGHLALVKLAKKKARRVVVSIFVNPTQFAPHEDFDRYPRTLQADSERMKEVGVDVVFAPRESEIYPEPQTFVVEPSDLQHTLDGAVHAVHEAGLTRLVPGGARQAAFLRPSPIAVHHECDVARYEIRGDVRHAHGRHHVTRSTSGSERRSRSRCHCV